jgi:hypothetical protein
MAADISWISVDRVKHRMYDGLIWCKNHPYFSRSRVQQATNDAACDRNMGYAKTPEDKLASTGTYREKPWCYGKVQGQGETTQKCRNL